MLPQGYYINCMNKIWQYSVPTQDIISSKNSKSVPVSSSTSSIPDEIPDEMQPETEAESEKCNLSRRKKMAIASSRGRNFNINSKNRYLDRILVPRSNFGGDICNQYPGASNFGSENRFGYSESMKRPLQGEQETANKETFKRYRGFDEMNYVPDTTEYRYDLCVLHRKKYILSLAKLN